MVDEDTQIWITAKVKHEGKYENKFYLYTDKTK